MAALAPAHTASASRTSRLPYFPAVEGMRGLAVAAVLLFHSGYTWAQGGYLGVSSFFTLSGFLITSLLIGEHHGTGTVNLRTFWARRFRRLMPAALAALGLAVVYGLFAADAVQKRNLAGDVAAAAAYVANWRFLLSNQSYADVFGAPSPVLHFWSLAIEEQFYLLFPLLVWAIVGLTRSRTAAANDAGRTRLALVVTLAVLAAASLATALFAGFSQDAIYFGTGTRASELLVGALLAFALNHHGVTGRLAHHRPTRSLTAAVGVAALALMVALWALTPQNSAWLYHGGFTAYALLSAVVITAALTPGPLRWALARRPLCALGLISYGAYLYHWPIFLWINEEGTGWPAPVLLAVRLGLTFAIAYLSYRYLEQPIRRGQPLFNLRPIRLAPIAIAALVVASLLLTRSAPQPVIDFEQAAAQFNNRTVDAGGPPGTLDTAALEPPRPRISVFGDSTALLTGNGLTLGNDNRVADFAYGFTQLGCGIGRGGERRSGPRLEVIPDGCNNWAQTWKTYIDANKPNIAVVQVGPWEVVDRKLAGDDQWRAPGDPVYDDYLLKEMIAAVDVLSAQGAEVIWLTSPPIKPGVGDGEHVQFARGQGEDPARMARFDQLIAALPRERPGRVHVLDLAGWLKASGEDERLRPDGVHLGMNGENAEVAKRWLLQAIVDVFDQDWRLRVANDPTAGKPTEPTSTSPTVDCRPPYQVCRAVS